MTRLSGAPFVSVYSTAAKVVSVLVLNCWQVVPVTSIAARFGVGVLVGVFVGVFVGVLVGVFVGVLVGVFGGVHVGVFVGALGGASVGVFVGLCDDLSVVSFAGALVGVFVLELVGVFGGVRFGEAAVTAAFLLIVIVWLPSFVSKAVIRACVLPVRSPLVTVKIVLTKPSSGTSGDWKKPEPTIVLHRSVSVGGLPPVERFAHSLN